MPVQFREVLSAVAALHAAALAAFVLLNPRGGHWTINASDRELDRWTSSQPTGVVVGVTLVVITVAGLQRSGSRRAAWALAAVCVGILITARWAVPHVGGVDVLIALHFAKTAAAGILLGAAVAAVWGRMGRLMLTLGVTSAFILAAVASTRHDRMTTSSIGEPPWWILFAALTLVVVAAVFAGPELRVQRPDRRTIALAIAGALGLAVVNRLLGAWIEGQEYGGQVTIWLVVAVSIAAVLAGTVFIARQFPGTDGRFLLSVTGVTASAMPMVNTLRSPFTSTSPWLMIVVGFLALAVGLRAAGLGIPVRWRRPELGLAVAALVPLAAAIWPTFGLDGPGLLLRLSVLGLGAGLALGASLPGAAPVAALGFGLPFASLVLAAASTVPSSRIVYSGSYEPLPGIPSATANETANEQALAEAFVKSYRSDQASLEWGTSAADHLVGVAMLLVVAFCAVGLASSVTTRRAEPDPAD